LDWPQLEELLQTCTHPNFSHAELTYLQDSYVEIEAIWEKYRSNLSKINYIILGEAPLYGADKKYIYSENGEPSTFLRPSDFPTYDESRHGSGKKALSTLLAENKMIVVDLFPYALNRKDTPSLVYKDVRKSKYSSLYRQIFINFTALKIKEIRAENPDVSILVRYKRLLAHVAPALEEMGFADSAERGGYIGINSSNMWINKNVFWRFCKA
jgi:hypothetical protein